MKVKEQMRETVTPRQLIERWTPGLCGDGSELALVLAIESTAFLIGNGAIPESRETRTFMEWREKWRADYLSEDDDELIH